MNFSSAVFENSYGRPDQLPESDLFEVCFAGKSNVGKSSLINKVLGRKSIARVSSTPGKTVTINFYKLDNIRLVDLPGYGYAKITDKEKLRFSELMEHYFSSGRKIKCCFALMDMRHLPTKQDVEMLEYLRYYNIPYVIVLTKCDKLNKAENQKMLDSIKENLGELQTGHTVLPFSSLKGIGVEELRDMIGK